MRPCVLAAILGTMCGCTTFKMPDMLGPGPGAKKAQRREEAVRLFEENRGKAEMESARACWEHGDLKGCEQTLTSLLSRQKSHREALLLKAELCLAERRFDEAQKSVEVILATSPNDAESLLTLAQSLDAGGDSDKAMDAYRRAAEAEPNNDAYSLAYRAALDGAGRGKGKKGASSVAGADCAGKSGSAEAAAGVAYQKGIDALRNGDAESALVALREAADANPDNLQIPLQAAAAALKSQQPDVAIELLVPLEGRMASSAEFYRMLGLAYCRSGEYSASQVALQQALSLDKSNAVAYFLMGCTLSKVGEPQKADEYFRQAQSLDPRYTALR